MRLGLLLLTAVVGSLILAPAASGAIRYAEPDSAAPHGGDPCLESNPCGLEIAVEAVAQNGDEVVVLPGNYLLESSDLTVNTNLDVHGVSPSQKPRITIDSLTGDGVIVTNATDAAKLRDLEIVSLGSGTALSMALASGATAERLYVSGDGSETCMPSRSGVLRDSVCWNTSGGDAVAVAIGSTGALSWRLVNVTAVAAGVLGAGIALETNNGCNCLINATNVIADGRVRRQSNDGQCG